jgi:3-phenylpropionate/trans-cinnamate dioxygenase ferredoxin reductase subunit
MRTITIVGASLAGWHAAQELRLQGFTGRIHVVGRERHRPYDRPPLSKRFLTGAIPETDLALAEDDEQDAIEATWHLGRAAVELDTGGAAVVLDDGTRLPTDGVVVATGGTPRTLSEGHDLPGVHTLRTLDDAIGLRADLAPGARAVVVGGGFIGAEVASTCHELGLNVTVVETHQIPLSRIFGTRLGMACAALHGDHGVRLLTGTRVRRLRGHHRVSGVELDNNWVLPADVVVVGVGMRPNIAWLRDSGLSLSDGVSCDSGCVTDLPNVVAVGDVAQIRGTAGRFEHWSTALEQPATAVRNLLAGSTVAEFAAVPYFWSEQYGVRIQFAGYARPDDEISFVDGSPDDRRFVATYQRGSTVMGVVAMDNGKLFTRLRKQLTIPQETPAL